MMNYYMSKNTTCMHYQTLKWLNDDNFIPVLRQSCTSQVIIGREKERRKSGRVRMRETEIGKREKEEKIIVNERVIN